MPILPLSESLKDFLYLHDSEERVTPPPLTPRAQAAHDFLAGSGQLLRPHNNGGLFADSAKLSDTILLSTIRDGSCAPLPTVDALPAYLTLKPAGLERQRVAALAELAPLLAMHPTTYVRLHREMSDARTAADLAATRERAAVLISARVDLLALTRSGTGKRLFNERSEAPAIDDAGLEFMRTAALRDIAKAAAQNVRHLAQAVDEVEVAGSPDAIQAVLERLHTFLSRGDQASHDVRA